MRKLPARKLLGAIIAGALFLPETAFTLGLGEIEVNSALNQKLKAEIELLSATAEDAESIIVKLASRKEFSRAGLDRPYLLNDLRFKSEVIDGTPHIVVTSGSPIREPFLNFLVEIDWPKGHLLREYTVLLDPPVFMTQQTSTATTQSRPSGRDSFRPASGASSNTVPVVTQGVTTSPRPVAGSAAPAPQPQPQTTTPTYVPAPYVQQQATIKQPPGSYKIKAGDTTWSLAKAMRPDQSITIEQMMIAMLRSNPESFIDGNINGLKRGFILRVPDYNQIAAINPQQARALVREQAALWRQYQQAHAGGQPASAMSSDEAGSSAGDGGAALSGEESDAHLEIVSAGSGTSTMSTKDPTQMSAKELRAELALARERVETERVEKEVLQQRVNSLEQSADKMKGMLSIEDDELSDVQALGSPAESEPSEAELLEQDKPEDTAAEMDESIAETDDLLAEQNLDDAISEETTSLDETSAEDTSAEDVDAGVAEEVVAEGEETDESAVFLDETSADAGAADTSDSEIPEDSESDQQDAVPDEVASQPQIVSRPPAADPLSKLLNDPMLLAAAGGGLLLVLALIGLIIKRRKAAAETEAVDPMMDMFASGGTDDLESLADEIAAGDKTTTKAVTGESQANKGKMAAAGDVDPDATMVLDSSIEDTIVAEEGSTAVEGDDKARDDVIAEADVYLAYGIYQQAEELLTQAIADNPERDDYRVKLAETHYAGKNADKFAAVAAEIKNRASDENSPAWKKVMVMGQDLCADNPMFQGSMVGGVDVDSLAPKAPEMDFDLGTDAVEDSDATPDLSLDEQSLELPDMEESGSAEIEVAKIDDEAEIEFDLSDTGAVEETPAAAEDEFSLDIDASELDVDIKHEAEESVTDEGQDVADMDIDFGLDEDTSPAESTAESTIASTDEEDFDLSSLDDVDEVSTKLDLARAYLDMGDHEGTRGILEEVIAEGDDEQKQEARKLMADLD